MTAQSDWPQASSRAYEAEDDITTNGASPADTNDAKDTNAGLHTDADPDIVIVSGREDSDPDDLLDDDDEDDADRQDAAGLHDDIVLAEVISETDVPRLDDADTGQDDADTAPSGLDSVEVAGQSEPEVVEPAAARPVVPEPSAANSSLPGSDGDEMPGTHGLGQQWRDIQAQFVDDPGGSVQLAAAAADEAVSGLVEALHGRQAGLVPAGGVQNDPGSTEQLREALRSYRQFCENLADVSQRLAQPESAAR